MKKALRSVLLTLFDERFALQYAKFFGLLSLACVINIVFSVIGSHTGSLIWGEVATDYTGPMLFFSVLAVPMALMEVA